MRSVVIGAHLLREDIEPEADVCPVGDLFLSVVRVPDEQPLGNRDFLLHVSAIRARLLDKATFVALRYGVTIANEDDALAKCAAFLPRWRALLAANRENVEMTLKVAAASRSKRPDRHDFASGADYLRALHGARAAADADPRFRQLAEEIFAPLAVDYRWQHRDESSIEMAALVPRKNLEAVGVAGERLRREAPSTPFLLSGPWPLEVFADDHQ